MKVWAILGLLLLAAGVVQMFLLREDPAPQSSVEAFMIEMAARLEEYADGHEGRYPESFEELDLVGISNRAAEARDPWGRFYGYERHPSDPYKYRFFTLGKDGVPAYVVAARGCDVVVRASAVADKECAADGARSVVAGPESEVAAASATEIRSDREAFAEAA